MIEVDGSLLFEALYEIHLPEGQRASQSYSQARLNRIEDELLGLFRFGEEMGHEFVLLECLQGAGNPVVCCVPVFGCHGLASSCSGGV